MRLDLGPSLAQVKKRALGAIDTAAEATRLRYVTPGAGQAMEYAATEAEARRWAVDTVRDEASYPFLAAERQAALEGAGVALTLDQVATEVLTQADGWIAIGSEIKRIRRQAKIAVENATTVAEVKSVVDALVWP